MASYQVAPERFDTFISMLLVSNLANSTVSREWQLAGRRIGVNFRQARGIIPHLVLVSITISDDVTGGKVFPPRNDFTIFSYTIAILKIASTSRVEHGANFPYQHSYRPLGYAA